MIPTGPIVSGVGSSFFTEIDSKTTYRRLLLVRLAVTQYHDLFATDQTAVPLATQGGNVLI